MPYGAKSTNVWYNLPGVVVAYQSIAAPDPFAAQQNVAYNGARFGVYTAMPGVLPTWHGALGWTLNGTSHYFTTNLVPGGINWSMFVRFSGGALSGTRSVCGAYSSAGGNKYFNLSTYNAGKTYHSLGDNYLDITRSLTAGVMGFASKTAYLNGLVDGTIPGAGSPPTHTISLGCRNSVGTNDQFFAGNIQALGIYSRELTRSEAQLVSRQMAYCEVNPDWNAWSRRRRYYYAPQAVAGAAFQAAWAHNANSILQVSS